MPTSSGEPRGGGAHKPGRGLMALASTAILAVYSAGYLRTRAAADRFSDDSSARRAAHALVKSPEPSRSAAVSSPAVAARSSRVDPAPSSTPGSPPANEHTDKPAARQSAVAPRQSAAPDAQTTEPLSPNSVAPTPEPPAPLIEAPANPETAPAVEATSAYRDGVYTGWGSCRHGDIQAEVVISSGRIASATIVKCLTRYSCSVIDAIIGQVVQRQSADVDYISGATQSADAFSDAVAEALNKAR